MSIFWAMVAAGTASAAIPVVHSGEAKVVTAAMVAQTGLPAEQFTLRSMRDLRRLPARVVGGASLRHCAGATTQNTAVRAHQVRAEAALRDGQLAEAQDHLDLGISALGCLGERVEGRVAARLFLLRAALLTGDDADNRSRLELQTAISLDPTVEWIDGIADDRAILLGESKVESRRVELSITPPVRGAAPWIDGHPVKSGVVLRPGLHLVQVPGMAGLRSAWLTVDGDTALVLPENHRDTVLAGVGVRPPDRHSIWLLQATLDAPSAYVVHSGGIWLVELGGDKAVVTELRAPDFTVPDEGLADPPKPKGRRGR